MGKSSIQFDTEKTGYEAKCSESGYLFLSSGLLWEMVNQ